MRQSITLAFFTGALAVGLPCFLLKEFNSAVIVLILAGGFASSILTLSENNTTRQRAERRLQEFDF